MENPLRIETFIGHEREGSYFTIPFDMPADMEAFSLTYRYEHHSEGVPGEGGFLPRRSSNIIDLGLLAPDGSEVGESGSDKDCITVSESDATPGYQPHPLVPGTWGIVVGAYKVAAQGVTVQYELAFTPKRLRLLKGDLHIHTLASDGVLRADELGQHARRHGLDFLAITDHNQMSTRQSLGRIPGLTLIPGVEWTHYQGHATFLGVDKPYDGPFFSNTPEETRQRFEQARARGALITLCHPFDENCPFLFDMQALPYDCLEIWNGPMRMSNIQAVAMWHGLLAEGRKVPAVGGSDYHRDHLFLLPGGPSTCVWSMSPGASDILAAVKQGRSYLVYAPDGPELEMTAGEALPGDRAPWASVQSLAVRLSGLQAGDVVQVVTRDGGTTLVEAKEAGSFHGTYRMEAPGFARVVVLRAFVPGIPALPALLSNPIFFEQGGAAK